MTNTQFEYFPEQDPHNIFPAEYITSVVSSVAVGAEAQIDEILDDNKKVVSATHEQLGGHEMPKAHIEKLGSLRDLAPEITKGRLVLPGREVVWTGGISKQKRIEKTPSLKARYEKATNPTHLETYYVPASLTSRVRCIDGRLLAEYLTNGVINEAMIGRDLGAQVPGGTPATALIRRIVTGDFSSAADLSKDIEEIAKIHAANGIRMGGHIDEHKEGHDFDTGCGAIDRMLDILGHVTNDETLQEVEVLTQALLGKAFDADVFDTVVGRLHRMNSIRSQYFKYDEKQNDYAFKREAMDVLRRNAEAEHHPVAKLIGDHNEMLLVVNYVPNTTFDRDRFWVDNDGEVQVFNYDLWRSFQLAEVLYPIDYGTQTADEQSQNLRARQIFVMGRVMYAIATAMILTDGTVDLALRQKQ